ncbi:hypothetical protein DFH28DRAFT_926849 [Melampsora americana]|nr:hypothetical protein DFH28DRAFT_926849 [Melampsora americana]
MIKGFIETINDTNNSTFTCVACPLSRSMVPNSIAKHSKSANHKKHHKIWLAKQQDVAARAENHTPDVEPDPASQDDDIPTYTPDLADVQTDQEELEDRRKRLLDSWTKDLSALFRSPALSVNSSNDRSLDEAENHTGQQSNSEQAYSVGSDYQHPDDDAMDGGDFSWAPFSSLQAPILGFRKWLVRLFLGQQGPQVKIPAYSTVQALRKRLKKKFNFNICENLSPLEKPCFGLTELGNPYVMDFLEFIPEMPDANSKVHRLSQSKKWREELDEDLRVQMVEQGNTHFYLYELVQLQSKKIVIPFYFYKSGDQVLAKCVYAVQKFVKEGRASKIRTEFKYVSAFDSVSFSTINVNAFWRNFDQIELPNGQLMKTYCSDFMHAQKGSELIEVPWINPWRIKAQGQIIRHVPLVLYCDDLSGNVSKRWNKHMAFYFTLAGLPPKLANQEFNCHFLSTSNTSGALELADPLIDELNKLATDGFVAYDHKAKSDVFVMTTILCHLGDSPMHAEVTNTMNPTTSLTPCRICHLKVKSLTEKRSTKYVCDFVGIDEAGERMCLPSRDWTATVEGTKDLWNHAQLPGPISHFEAKSASLGLRDQLNMNFVKRAQDLHRNPNVSKDEIADMCRELNEKFGERLFNPFLRLKGFNGHRDTPVEILHVVLLGIAKYLLRHQMNSFSPAEKDKLWGRWRSFDTSGLQIPSIQPKTMIQNFQSLTGKEFRVVLQAAPFIFLETKMSDEEHQTWTALAHLSPYLFQTEITNIQLYLKQLENLIQIFLKTILNLSAQWCNKPKFHMLTHLCESIKRFGPPCLFATENFESYNGNTRSSSIHSNHLSPGRDIANSFNSSKVQELFQENKLFQKALGFNASWNKENNIEIGKKEKLQPSQIRDVIPNDIFNSFSAKDWKVLESVTLKTQQKVTANSFISFKKVDASNGRIAHVKRIWGVGSCDIQQIPIEASYCQVGRDIEGILNVQHNCYKSNCNVQKVKPIMIERQLSKTKEFAVVHETTTDFVLNSAAFYSAELHRTYAKMRFEAIKPQDCIMAVEKGLANWGNTIKRKDETKEKKRQKEIDKSLSSQMAHLPSNKKRRTKNGPSNSELIDRYLSNGQATNSQPMAGPSNTSHR